jgi:hypothetical protein
VITETIASETSRLKAATARGIEQTVMPIIDTLGPILLELPPFREVNHRIPLIDENLRYNYHLPRCPKALQEELRQKITHYTMAGWWEMKAVYQASPLLCVPKKNGKLCMVVDTQKRNDNTFMNITPFPDQDQIQMDVAPAKYWTKIDMSDTPFSELPPSLTGQPS